MKNAVLKAIKQYGLLEDVKNVTVALSGGADSMSLLHIMVSLRDELGITVNAAHLNHMIRGVEADRDEEFVRKECKKLGIGLVSERCDVPLYARENRMSTELAARELRYDFLSRVSHGAVATAHTASDNLETVLLNLARGSSLKGLCGIPAKRGIFIRPLLLCTRAEVEKYCSENGIPYVTDSTNLSDEYTRNRIRHNIIPVLKQINPSVEAVVQRTAFSVAEDEELLSSMADKYLHDNVTGDSGLDVQGFEDIAPSVAKRAVKRFFEERNPGLFLDNRHLCDIYAVCSGGGRVSLPQDLSAVVSEKRLFAVSNRDDIQNNAQYIVKMSECQRDFLHKDEKVNNLLLKNALDCDKIIGKSVIRTRQPGDSIRLPGRNGTKSLKKLFNECRIPTVERESLPVIADDSGVIWIHGIGPANRCAVTKATKRLLVIESGKADKE